MFQGNARFHRMSGSAWLRSGCRHAVVVLLYVLFLFHGASAQFSAPNVRTNGPQRGHDLPVATIMDGRTGTHRLAGAVSGFVVGAGATYFVTRQGGSTSLCDRSRNQDALSSQECLGLVVLGGAVGAGIGALIGHAIKSEARQFSRIGNLQIRAAPERSGRLVLSLTAFQ